MILARVQNTMVGIQKKSLEDAPGQWLSFIAACGMGSYFNHFGMSASHVFRTHHVIRSFSLQHNIFPTEGWPSRGFNQMIPYGTSRR